MKWTSQSEPQVETQKNDQRLSCREQKGSRQQITARIGPIEREVHYHCKSVKTVPSKSLPGPHWHLKILLP